MTLRKRISKAAGSLLKAVVVPPARLIYLCIPRTKPETTLMDILRERALASTADFVEQHMAAAMRFPDRMKLMDFALSKIPSQGMCAEFGVFKGESISHIAARLRPGATVYGFDSFEGLHENWSGTDLSEGHFSLGGAMPTVPKGVELIRGWFDQSLPPFLETHPGAFAFVHVDCDTYEATRTLFGMIGGRLGRGSIVVFDEFFGYSGWLLGEAKAWREFVDERKLSFAYIAFSEMSVAVEIL